MENAFFAESLTTQNIIYWHLARFPRRLNGCALHTVKLAKYIHLCVYVSVFIFNKCFHTRRLKISDFYLSENAYEIR